MKSAFVPTRSPGRQIAVATLLLVLSGCSRAPEAVPPEAKTETLPANALEVVMTYGSEKEDWINEVTEQFNAAKPITDSGRPIVVRAIPMGSGETIEEILDGTRQPHLVSPASEAFIKLGNAKSQAKTGRDLVGPAENLVLSPVVIAMWKPMAEAIGWGTKPIGWSDILALAKDKAGWGQFGYPQWGAFKFGHTHPESSNSGLISLFAEVYAGAGKVAGLTVTDVASPAVASFLGGIEKSVVHYGSSTGFFGKKMFANGPGYLSAAVLYENMVIESSDPNYKLPFPIVAIYPKEGTFWSDHPVAVVDREWVSAEHREAAKKYVDFLLARPQQEKAIPHGFRPSAVDVPLAAPIDVAHGVDPLEPKTTLEVPSVAVMDAILALWQEQKKHSNVSLVIDVSGSMQEDNRIENARTGSLALLAGLGAADRFALLPFNDQLLWADRGTTVRDGRAASERQLGSLYASGGTALYDAIAAAYEKQTAERDTHAGLISAVVVLTDGQDTDSKITLDELLAQVRFDNEGNNVRIFTIGYGSGAQAAVLKKISDATQAKYYDGTPENIRSIFRDIATFF